MALKKQVKLFLILCNLSIFVSCVIIWSPSALCGEIFFWTDKRGVQHYSNVKPSESGQNIKIYEETNYSNRHVKKNNYLENNIPFKVVKVYDGDSMKVKGGGIDLMIRLIGIDAPESKGRKLSKSQVDTTSQISQMLGIKHKKIDRREDGQPFNQESKMALINILGKKEFYIKSYGTDRYNRILAEVFTDDGTLVNLEMVKIGMAEVYRGVTEKGFDSAPYMSVESEAKRAKRGIWSLGSDYQSPKEWRKRN